jgi:hypothetical protein
MQHRHPFGVNLRSDAEDVDERVALMLDEGVRGASLALARTCSPGTVVTTRVDGVPHGVLRTTLVDGLISAGPLTLFPRAIRNAAASRSGSIRDHPRADTAIKLALAGADLRSRGPGSARVQAQASPSTVRFRTHLVIDPASWPRRNR